MTRDDLLKRVEAATGTDREIDKALMALVYVQDERHIGVTEGWENEPESFAPVTSSVWVDPLTNRWVSTAPHSFTSSIDAALALVERMLPGWARGFDWGPETCMAFVDPHDYAHRMFGARHTATAPTPPLAILSALLRALPDDAPVAREVGNG